MKRHQYTPEFKVQAVIEVIREEGTVSEIAAKYGVNPVMLGRRKAEFLERAAGVFKEGPTEAEKGLEEERKHIADLERNVGQLTYEVDWLKRGSGITSPAPQAKQLNWSKSAIPKLRSGANVNCSTFTGPRCIASRS
jgi:putative transposase